MEPPFTEHILERLGCPIHYWEGGPPGSPLVVFTHGLCVDHHSFDPHLPVIAKTYRVLTWDVRGHGRSQPMGQPFTVPLAVEDLLAIVDGFKDVKAAFVGHSNGTYILQELVFRYPERVQALAMADGSCITWEHTAFENWLVRVSPELMSLFPYEMLKRSGLGYVSARKDVQDYTYAAYSQLTKKDYIALMRGAFQCLHSEPGYHIPVPLLLTHGDDDRMGDILKIAPRWAAREPDCRYVIIPNARHFAILDNPEFFNRILLEFLASVFGAAKQAQESGS